VKQKSQKHDKKMQSKPLTELCKCSAFTAEPSNVRSDQSEHAQWSELQDKDRHLHHHIEAGSETMDQGLDGRSRRSTGKSVRIVRQVKTLLIRFITCAGKEDAENDREDHDGKHLPCRKVAKGISRQAGKKGFTKRFRLECRCINFV
jgi:hypothetical protein